MEKSNRVLRSTVESGLRRSMTQNDAIESRGNRKSIAKLEFLRLMECLVQQNMELIKSTERVIMNRASNEDSEEEESNKETVSELTERKNKLLREIRELDTIVKNNKKLIESPKSATKTASLSTTRSSSIKNNSSSKKVQSSSSKDLLGLGEFIEEGKCDIPFALKRNPTNKDNTESYKTIHYIVRRFRDHESPDGGSAYKHKIITIDDERFFICELFCYARPFESCCNVRLRIEYNVDNRVYKLFKLGDHNHVFNNKSACKKWDMYFDDSNEKLPVIQILKTTILSNEDEMLSKFQLVKRSDGEVAEIKNPSIKNEPI